MKNLNVRMDDELHARLKEAAVEADRSLNGQIVALLKSALSLRDYKVSREIFRETS